MLEINTDRKYAQVTYILTKSIIKKFPQLTDEFSAQLSSFSTYKLMIGENQFELEKSLESGLKELNELYAFALPDDLVAWVVSNAYMFHRIISHEDYDDDAED